MANAPTTKSTGWAPSIKVDLENCDVSRAGVRLSAMRAPLAHGERSGRPTRYVRRWFIQALVVYRSKPLTEGAVPALLLAIYYS